MKYLLKNAKVYISGAFVKKDLLIQDGVIISISKNISDTDAIVYDFSEKHIFPGFVDVHVHLREPGFIMKETIQTGTMAAAHGGYTTVMSMPNLKPAPDCFKNLKPQLNAINEDAKIKVYPFGTITKNQQGEELSNMTELSPYVAGFSDDGKGVQSEELMKEAMLKAKQLNKIIVAHCEDNSLLNGGYIHKGEYAEKHSHKGICSESEWLPIARDIELVRQTGCKYHICHVSAKESVELIRRAKKQGLDITAETAPHYLTLDESDLKDEGRFKMNPPIRTKKDREALIEGILDGTIEIVATDHAPHTAEEKSKGLKDSLMGVVGLETAFPVLYSSLVKRNIITLEKLIEIMSVNPAKRFSVENGIKENAKANLTVFDLNERYKINPAEFLSKGKSTPFENTAVYGSCLMTMMEGKIVWKKEL